MGGVLSGARAGEDLHLGRIAAAEPRDQHREVAAHRIDGAAARVAAGTQNVDLCDRFRAAVRELIRGVGSVLRLHHPDVAGIIRTKTASIAVQRDVRNELPLRERVRRKGAPKAAAMMHRVHRIQQRSRRTARRLLRGRLNGGRLTRGAAASRQQRRRGGERQWASAPQYFDHPTSLLAPVDA